MISDQNIQLIQEIAEAVSDEVVDACSKYPAMASAHEGYAVILEELDELWDEVKQKQPSRERMQEEAMQVAAMAMRFILDVVRDK